MAIKVLGSTVIDDSRNAIQANSLVFANNTSVSSAGVVLGETVGGIGSLQWTLDNPNPFKASGTSTNDQFGQLLAIDGNYAVIVAIDEDDAVGTGSGKAYIYNVTTGALLFTLDNPNPYSTSLNDQFGISVGISGNYAIIGARQEDDAGGASSGKAYIYNVTTGALVWTLNNPNAYSTSAGDQFGWQVAISSNYAIVSAYTEDDASGGDSGKAYIYNVTTGALLFTLNNPNPYSTSVQDYFGYSVSISGNYAIIGAAFQDDASGTTSGKAYIYNVTTGALVWTLDNPNAYGTSADDRFGASVAISGNYAIVGAYGEDDATSGALGDSGKAYIYNVTTGALLFTLNNPNAYGTSENDNFGRAVAISGNYAIVGAIYEDDAGSGADSGKAYIYNVTTGALLFTLNNPNAYSTSAGDQFGYLVAISGNYAIVGAFGEDDATGTSSGRVYVYDTTTASYLKTIDNPNMGGDSNDRFGYSVAISGNYAIVGAYTEDDAGGADSGKAYIYNVTTGTPLFTLNNPNPYSTSTSDQFGQSVAISGNYAIVSAYTEDDAGGVDSGKAYVYNVTSGALVWTLNNPNSYSTSTTDYFGISVAISGNYAIVNAYSEDDAGGTSSGKVYIFNVITGTLVWTLSNPNPYSTSAYDNFGFSVAISGNYAIVGAYYEADAGGSGSGKAYIYNVTTGALLWTLNNPNPYSTSFADSFGQSVAISGNYAIIGARIEDDAGGTSSGKAYIYNVTTGALVWILNNPNAYSTSANDQFGISVAISGNYAIVGAINEDDAGGTESGKAYIYNVTTGVLVWTLNNPNAYSTSQSDQFGTSVAISGNYAIVGAYWEDDYTGISQGKAYIFSLSPTTDLRYVEEIEFANGVTVNFIADKAFETAYVPGQLVWTLNNPNAYSTSAYDNFGFSVAISGNYAIVSAWGEDDIGGSSSGKAYIYNVTTGALVWTLNNPNAYSTSASDSFGISTAISGNYAIVGAHQEDDAGGTDSGKAYIYNVTTGQLLFTLNNPNAYSTSAYDNFGFSVAISGNYAIVGAYYEADAGGSGSGKAYIYNVTTGQLLWTLNNPNAYSTSQDDYFGWSVAISGNYAIVSADEEEDASGTTSGKAYIFNVTTGALLWTLNNPNAYSTSQNDNFGISVALSGNYAIVGAAFEEDVGGASSGKAYIYNVTTGTLLWTLDNPNAYSTKVSDVFGYSVAISGDYAIVGAAQEGDAGGSSSGKAYIYNVTTGALLLTVNNPNAYSTSTSDTFGSSVSISGDYAIVGAAQEDDASGADSGKAYIFSVTNQTYLDKIITVGNSIF